MAADSKATLAIWPPLNEPRMSGQNKLDLGNFAAKPYNKKAPPEGAGLHSAEEKGRIPPSNSPSVADPDRARIEVVAVDIADCLAGHVTAAVARRRSGTEHAEADADAEAGPPVMMEAAAPTAAFEAPGSGWRSGGGGNAEAERGGGGDCGNGLGEAGHGSLLKNGALGGWRRRSGIERWGP